MTDAQHIRLMLGSIPTFALMILLFPVFVVLALLYIAIHSDRADGTEERSGLVSLIHSPR